MAERVGVWLQASPKARVQNMTELALLYGRLWPVLTLDDQSCSRLITSTAGVAPYESKPICPTYRHRERAQKFAVYPRYNTTSNICSSSSATPARSISRTKGWFKVSPTSLFNGSLAAVPSNGPSFDIAIPSATVNAAVFADLLFWMHLFGGSRSLASPMPNWQGLSMRGTKSWCNCAQLPRGVTGPGGWQ